MLFTPRYTGLYLIAVVIAVNVTHDIENLLINFLAFMSIIMLAVFIEVLYDFNS